MKLILKQYLASLKERSELDALLPSLLSSMGMNVFILPTRGVKEYGVDIAAVGSHNCQEEKVYLFSVKPGNLTRETWNGSSDQALRPSLDEIQDSFIPSRLPPEHRDKSIVICLCFGGDVNSGIRQEVSGYEQRNSNDIVSFEEWNGDRLSELIQQYLLKEELLPDSSQASLRKSLAVLEEPESSVKHFLNLTNNILLSATEADKAASSITRLNVCLWVLFSWCRDEKNIEAAYLAAEKSILLAWEEIKSDYTGRNKVSKAFDGLLDTYHLITDTYVDQCIIPHVDLKFALSHAVNSPCPIGVNLKLFDVLGRLSVKGHWILELLSKDCSENPPTKEESEKQRALRSRLELITKTIKLLVVNNPMLLSPYKDSHSIDLGLAFTLLWRDSKHDKFVKDWLAEVVNLCIFTFESNGMYPTVLHSYENLLEHKYKDKTDDDYKQKVTNGSVLYPLLAVFCALYDMDKVSQDLELFAEEQLGHTTLQYWYPNQYSEHRMYSNSEMHGTASPDFPMSKDSILDHIGSECRSSDSFREMSVVTQGMASIVITACRCYRYPVPFHFIEDWLSTTA
ncbi:MAG: hypothetical protein CMI12_07430 [Oceanospirillum sp.]|nr:hypothetical protein [Oceanospirillum sp.]